MASNTIILTKPTEGSILDHQVPEDSSARLNYERGDIEGLSIGSNGELVMTFANGGQVNITNFESFVENGNLLYLEDGTLIDASILTNTPLKPQALNTIETAAGEANSIIQKPAANTTQEITVEEGVNYVCDFDPENAALVEVKDGQMILTFADGSQVIINNYNEVVAGQLPDELTVTDAAVVDNEILTEITEVEQPSDLPLEVVSEDDGEQVANIEPAAGNDTDIPDAVAEALAEVEPAAGPAAAGSVGRGYGFNSSPDEVEFGAPGATGPLGATSLAYDRPEAAVEGVAFDDAPVVVSQVPTTIDESDDFDGDGKIEATGQFFADAGNDGLGSYSGNGSFNSSGATGTAGLTSNGVAVVVTYDAATNTYTGDAGGVTVFTLEINPLTGAYTYIQCAPLDHDDPTDDNEEICLEFGAQITDSDGDSDSGIITIKVADDAPEANDVTDRVDETDGFVANTVTGGLDVDGGYDNDVEICGNGDFQAGGNLTGGTLTSKGNAVTVSFDATTNTYTGTAAGVSVFTMVIDPITGNYTFTLLGQLDHSLTDAPNEALQLTFGYKTIDGDGDQDTGSIKIVVLDDAPVAVDDGAFPLDESQTVNGNVTDNDTISSDATNTVTVVTFNGVDTAVPSTGTITVTGTYGVLTIAADGTYSYTANSNNPDGQDVFTYTLTDGDGDTDTADITFTVSPIDDVPVIVSEQATVDETDLPGVIVNGQVDVDYGTDGPGEVCGTDNFESSGSRSGDALTSAGVPVVVTFDATTNTYTGAAGTQTIFTMVINADGSYTFELLGTLDHADASNPNDIINLDFGIKAIDNDDNDGNPQDGSDSTESTIRIRVKDDVPVIGDSSGDVDETNFDNGPLTYTDTIDTDFGQDLGAVAPNNSATPSVPLFSNGVAVTISSTGNTYTGVAGGTVVFTLVVDPATGEYTYTQFESLDHPNSNDSDDVISIDFGVAVTSFDGDSDTGIITINIADDGPIAQDDISGGEEGQLITGDVTANDNLSNDEQNTVTNVAFNGVNYAITPGTPTVVTGDYGVLTINSDGTYSYVTNNNDPDGTDLFTYTLVDGDGDSDTANLSIVVTPDGQPVAVNEMVAVDETNIPDTGPLEFTGTMNIDFGLDGAGQVKGNGSFESSGSQAGGQLTSNGVPVIVTLSSGNIYTGMAGTEVIFTLELNNDGTYVFNMFSHLDHADNTDPNDLINLEFGVTAMDADGDAADGTLTIQVYDDAPVAYDDGFSAVIEELTVTGNVTNNDDLSEDAPNLVTAVIFNGTSTAVPATGSVAITGSYGVLTISADGSYSYTANPNNPEGTDVFTYALTDSDGDTDTAEIGFNVTPANDIPVVVTPDQGQVDETNLDAGDLTVNGTINVDYGNDGPGVVSGNNTFTSSETNLTSCGNPVVVTYDAQTGMYVGTAAGDVVFTLTINANGSYNFTQFAAIDHPDATNPNDGVTLNFGAKATDSDGDSTNTTITIVVLDDGPVISNKTNVINESGLGDAASISVSGTLTHDYGEDGAGDITATGRFEAKYQMDGTDQNLTSDGDAITVTSNADGYVGKLADGTVVFTLTINANGQYTYTQNEAIDHPGVGLTGNDDIIWLKFYVEITDKDGDTDTGVIVIDLKDDGPSVSNTGTGVLESKLEDGPIVITKTLKNLDFGADGAGSVESNGQVMVRFEENGPNTTLKSGGQNVTITQTANGYVGKLGDGTTVFSLTINSTTGKYTYKQFEPVDHNGAGDERLWIKLGVTVTDADGDTADAFISIDIRDDVADAVNDTRTTEDGKTVNGNVISNDDVGVDEPGTVMKVVFGGTTYNLPTNGNDVTINGKYGTLTINTTGAYSYKAKDGAEGVDQFTYTLKDSDGDTDNATLTITVDEDTVPTIDSKAQASNEALLDNGPIVIENKLTHDYGDDGAGSIQANGTVMTLYKEGGPNQTFTSCNKPIAITNTNNGYTGKLPDGTTVFTLTVNNDGTYKYTQYEPIDHPGANLTGTDDVIWLKFGVTITDKDGDTDTGFIQIDVRDDGPSVSNTGTGVQEGSLENGPITITKTLKDLDFGGDGAGSVKSNGEVMVRFEENGPNTTLKSGGQNVTITQTANGYVGKLGDGTTVFSLTINSTTGKYTYKQFEPVDHNGAGDERLWIKLGVTVTDKDGDTADAFISIDIRDDVPVAVNDSKTLNEGQSTTGNVISNDNVGVDEPGTIMKVVVGGTTYNLPTNGNNVTINGQYGVLTINKTGAYTYRANGSDDGVDRFTYTLKDGDGDTDTAVLTVTVRDNDVPVVLSTTGSTDDTVVDNNGNDVETGTINVDYKGDGPGTTMGTGSFNGPGGLSANGVAIAVTFSNGVYTGKAGNTTVFTMTINANGTYRFVQHEALDHSNTGSYNEGLNLTFGVKATDTDGDVGTGSVVITVRDDGPNAVNDSKSLNEGQSTTGNVISNDDVGGDFAGTIMKVVVGGTTYNLPTNGNNVTINGQYGVLTINKTGAYTYRANGSDDGVDRFTYTLKDGDGDTDTAVLTVTVRDNDVPVVLSTTGSTDDTVVDNNGNDVETGTINVDYKGDGPGTTMGTGSFNGPGGLSANGVAIAVTFSNGVYTGKAGNTTVFTMTINANGTYRFVQHEALDHSNTGSYNEGLNLTFGVKATDTDGDVGTGSVVITVRDDGPNAVNDSKSLNEGQSTTGNVISNDDVGGDFAGTIMKVVVGGTTYNLPTNGNNVTINGQYGVLTINKTGAYTYRANGSDDGVDRFTYTLKDGDGDTDTAVLTVTVRDNDVPVVLSTTGSTDDTVVDNNGNDVETGTINVDYKGDGPGTTMGTGSFNGPGGLSANGVAIAVTFSNGVYTGKAGNTTVFTMTINANGTYRFVQHEALDHSNTGSYNEGLNLTFGVKATDTDGDVGTGSVVITVRDDGPNAVNDSKSLNEGQSTTGNVISNDDVGGDFAGTIMKVVVGGTTYNLPTNGNNVTINGQYGVLTINKTGAYTYRANGSDDGVDRFTYTLKDGDGDTDTAVLTVTVRDNDVPVVLSTTGSTDDTVVDNNGNDVETGTINVDYKGDGPGTTMGNNSFSSSGNLKGGQLSHDGVPITVSFSGGTYTGKAGSTTVFTMTINANGTYRFVQHEALDHSNTGSYNEGIQLVFGVKATDADGDVGTGTVKINVYDDGPSAVNDGKTTSEGKTITGNVMSNDDVGGDASGTIMKVVFGGNTYNLPTNGNNVTITGSEGKLTINNSGAYTYKAFNNAGGGKDTFTYTLKDGDGDTDTANLAITVNNIDSKPIANDDRITETNFTSGKTYTGNLLTNDNFGIDGKGSPAVIQGHGVYNTNHGVLTVNQNGSFSLVRNNNNTAHNYELNYTIQDSDGDTASAVLRFSVTPLVLDLDGDGVELTNTQDGVMFDYDVDGELELTAWVRPDDGFLVVDRNQDGVINDRSEMFGDTNGFADGFANLTSYDSNDDGFITSADEGWIQIQVWRDLDQDGVTDDGELFSLDDLGIASINVSDIETLSDEVGDNYISAGSTYTTVDGQTHSIVDVHLNYNDENIDLSQYLVNANLEVTETLYGSAGADTFEFNETGNGISLITDFNMAQGDKLDISEIIDYNAGDDIHDFLFTVVSDGDTTIYVDSDGFGNGAAPVAVAQLEGESFSIDQLISGDGIIV